jgi:predicted flap endonuclease-1-like 5' DNA nuclease
VNGLSLLLLIALAIGIVVAYRAGIARGARGMGPLAALTSDPEPIATAATAPPLATDGPVAADASARLAQAQSMADERYALHRALADARGETARYRQLVVDLENDAPPPLLDSPGAPDDLKLIVGIGPVLERMLQQLGVSRYRQIARWSERDIDEFDARLPEFPGRIRRDGWVTQARELHHSKYGEALPPRDRA